MPTLKASPRTELRKSVKNRLRREGNIPAVVYGKTVGNTPVHVSESEFSRVMREEGRNALIDLNWDQNKATVMVTELQRDPIKNNVLHIDFQEINMTEDITAEVAIEWIGEAAGEKEGGILQKQYQYVEVTCLASKIPDNIPVDISDLDIGDTITVGDLNMDEGITIELPEDSVLISVLPPALEEEPAEEDGEQQEPELVDAQESNEDDDE